MSEADLKVLEEMTVEKYLAMMAHGEEDQMDEARDAIADICLYLYANTDVDDLEIDDMDIDGDCKVTAAISLEVAREDAGIIQKDVDDFIIESVSGSFKDTVDFTVNPEMTFMEIAKKMEAEINREAERVIEHAIEKAAEEYREYHHSRGCQCI